MASDADEPGRSDASDIGGQLHRSTQVQADECLQILRHARDIVAGEYCSSDASGTEPDPEMVQGGARSVLLAQKRSLGTAMEELRATMRTTQERCEQCTVESRNLMAKEASARTLVVALCDELTKVHGQLRRASQQVADHVEARRRLAQELSESATVFQGIVAQEVEAHAAMEHEVSQLQQVVRDLESRLRSKSCEIERLTQVNTKASEEFAALTAKLQCEREECLKALGEGPFGACTGLLAKLAAGELPRPMSTTSDLKVLRSAFNRREEHLAALRRKVKFLSEHSQMK